jgi:phage terminase large subunit-like protein
VTPFVQAGNVWLPSREVIRASRDLAWDVEGFVDECSSFPFGTNDDQVDQMTQYLNETRVKLSKSRWVSPTTPQGVKRELTAMEKRLARAN